MTDEPTPVEDGTNDAVAAEDGGLFEQPGSYPDLDRQRSTTPRRGRTAVGAGGHPCWSSTPR